jgi:hypothetical protein
MYSFLVQLRFDDGIFPVFPIWCTISSGLSIYIQYLNISVVKRGSLLLYVEFCLLTNKKKEP